MFLFCYNQCSHITRTTFSKKNPAPDSPLLNLPQVKYYDRLPSSLLHESVGIENINTNLEKGTP